MEARVSESVCACVRGPVEIHKCQLAASVLQGLALFFSF